jgi:hypothetical protein
MFSNPRSQFRQQNHQQQEPPRLGVSASVQKILAQNSAMASGWEQGQLVGRRKIGLQALSSSSFRTGKVFTALSNSQIFGELSEKSQVFLFDMGGGFGASEEIVGCVCVSSHCCS